MIETLLGKEIGVPQEEGKVYHPYPVSPVEDARSLAARPEQPLGIITADAHLPNPAGRNLVSFFPGGKVIRAFDLTGLIVHNPNKVELTDSPLEFVRESSNVVGTGAIIMSSEEDFTIHAIATRSDFRAAQLEDDGARVFRQPSGLHIAQIFGYHFEITEVTDSSVVGRRIATG